MHGAQKELGCWNKHFSDLGGSWVASFKNCLAAVFYFFWAFDKNELELLGLGGPVNLQEKLVLLTECFFFQKQNIDGIDATPPTTTFWVNQNITPIISKIKYFFTFFCARQIAALVRPLVLAPRSPLARPLLAPRSPLARPSLAPRSPRSPPRSTPRSPLVRHLHKRSYPRTPPLVHFPNLLLNFIIEFIFF